MGGRISRFLSHSLLIVIVAFCCGCAEERPKSSPSPFDEQQAIVHYDEIKKGEFTVQIGDIHKSLNSAVVVSARLRGSSVANFIETTENCTVYRVCVGKFRSKDRAESMKDSLLRKNLRCGAIKVEGALKDKVGPCN
jgi:cell division septation protein DedD